MSDSSSQNPNPKYAWRELARKGLPKRSAPQRAADFLEIYGLFDEATAREQASRCIQCPNPTCVTGCPLCNPVPQWMQLTAEGRFLEAAAVLGSVTNMAEICTRLCPSDRMCEHACILEGVSEPVAIRGLEQFLAEYAFKHGKMDAATAPPNGLKVAVVGSGPGCLACAEELARKGYAVTIFDSAIVPGGLLVNGTPAFKVEQSVLQRRIDLLKQRGVMFRLGVELWNGLTLDRLTSDFDAVFLGFDSRQARGLNLPGEHLHGVVHAVPFILQKTTPVPLALDLLDVTGDRVLVLGAGDSAMDCLRAAIRYGAGEALCVYRRSEAEMPCSPRDYEDAREEGAQFRFQAEPIALLETEGEVTGVRFVETEPADPDPANQRREFRAKPGTEFELQADWVILALGFQRLPLPPSKDFAGLTLNDWGGLAVDANQMTSMPSVFASGDIVRGPGPLLESVRDGRAAAGSIDSWLKQRQAVPSKG
jgi:glutamate synthase (NADPH/NADH) small chain